MEEYDREDAYDETDLLMCVQDCGHWPAGQTSLRHEKYTPNVDWYACCRDLQRHLKDQDRIFQPVFLRLGQWDVVSKHLVPLLLHAKERGTSKQMYTFAKLFTQLTFSPDKDHPFDTRSDMYRYLETHKRACLREGVMSAFMSVMIEPLENAANEITTSKDVEKIELMLTLFTNLFKLPSKLDATRGAINFADAQQLQRELVSAAHREKLLDTILYVTQNIKTCESLNLKVLEVWCAILRGRDPRRLARAEATAALSKDSLQDKHDQLRRRRFQEMAAKRRGSRDSLFASANSRHGRWGGALKVVRCVGGGANIMGGGSLKDALYDESIPKIAAVDKSRGSNITDATTTAATRAQDFELQQVLTKLMACGCNELVQSTREAVFGNTINAALRLTEEDAADWMAFVRFVTNFHLESESRRRESSVANASEADENSSDAKDKNSAFDVTPVADAVCPQAFHTVIKMCFTMMEEKNWDVLTYAVSALHQMFAAVQNLCSDTSNDKNRNIGKQIYTHIFSDHGYLRLIPTIIKAYDGKKHRRELLISAVAAADIVLTMLEEVAEEGWVTTKKIKVRKQVRKERPDGTLAEQVHEQVETRVERREKVMELDFVDHVKKEYGSSQVIRQYCELLKDYKLHAAVTDNVVSFLELIVERCSMGPMLFQLSTFCLFSEILNTKGTKSLTHGERLHRICNIVLTEFFREFDKDRSILGRLLFWSRKGDVKSLQLEKRKEVELRQDQVGGEFGDSSEDEESDGDVLADVRRRLGRYKTKKRPWRREDGEKLVLLYGRWRDLPDHIRAELIASSYTDRTAADISRQLDKLRIGQTEKKGSRKRVTVGEEAESIKPVALMITIEKCLARLRKSLSDVTVQHQEYAAGLDWLAEQLRLAAEIKTTEAYALVPISTEEWRHTYAKWFQQTMLILCVQPPDPASGLNFWHIPASISRETLEEAAELVERVMKRGEFNFVDEDERDGDDSSSEKEAEAASFDDVAAEYNAEQASSRPRRVASERVGMLDELDQLEHQLAAKGASGIDSSSSDDDADDLGATIRQDMKKAESAAKERVPAAPPGSEKRKKPLLRSPAATESAVDELDSGSDAEPATQPTAPHRKPAGNRRLQKRRKLRKSVNAASRGSVGAEQDSGDELALDLDDIDDIIGEVPISGVGEVPSGDRRGNSSGRRGAMVFSSDEDSSADSAED